MKQEYIRHFIAGIAGALGVYAGGWLGLLAVIIAIIGTHNHNK